ncbi:MAG: sulfatase-like hydrolase/transferase [Desulfuromusa sp.]|nr:sulfatase-like hydrolase/transferase [Desulfuromusa sp.]
MTDAPFIWPISVLLYNIGLIFSFANIPQRWARIISYNLVSATFFIIEASFFLSFYVQNSGFNEAFFYHLRPDLLYAGLSEHLTSLSMIVACMFGFLIMSSFSLKENRPLQSWIQTVSIIVVFLGLFISPPAKDLVLFFENRSLATEDGALFEDFPELQGSSAKIEFSLSKRLNIVLIYAESLEQSFFDEKLFPNLLTNLKKVKEKSINFSNVDQGTGAGWTIGGIVASQCAYPLAVEHEVDPNDLNIFDKFLPKATCLGDLLEKDGYHLSFLGGADARFGGKEKFLRSHGYEEVLGFNDLKSRLVDDTYVTPWGLFDDTLFDYAIEKFVALNNEKSPFLLTLLTLDSHGFEGYKSKSCENYQLGENSILNSIHCSDQLVSKFIEQIRSSAYSENTLIIVVSDHLAMRNKASSLLESSIKPRRLTFFINTPEQRSEENSNPGLHYDIAPTILDIIGYDIDGQMGFGKPLALGSGYLPGKLGQDKWQKHSTKIMAIGNDLWDDEVVLDGNGIDFLSSMLFLTIGGREFDLKAGGFIDVPSTILFLFDNSTLALEKIYTFPLEQGLSRETLGEILLQNKTKLAMVISRSKYLAGFSDQHLNPDQWIFFFGRPGSDYVSGGPITGDFLIPFDLIKKLSHSKIDDRVVRERRRLLDDFSGKKTKK